MVVKSGAATDDADGTARVGAWQDLGKHSCILPAAGIESCIVWPALGVHIDVHSETASPPSAHQRAWASGCRKLRVIANSAAECRRAPNPKRSSAIHA